MTLLFDRRVEIKIYTSTEMHTLKGYHMSFDVLATRDSKPNTAKVSIINLSENQQNLFSDDIRGVEIYAGYKDEIGMIFRGSWDAGTKKRKGTSHMQHKQHGTNWVTSLETGDGLKEFQNTYFDKAYTAGTDVKSILKDVALSMGLPVMLDYEGNDVINSAISLSGRANIILDDLVDEYLLRWSIQHGAVEIVDRFEPPKKDATAVRLTTTSGIVGKPVITEKGLELTTMMMSTIKPTRLIQVDPAEVETDLGKAEEKIKSKIKPHASGVYIVDRIRYYGDTMGGKFNCDISSDLI